MADGGDCDDADLSWADGDRDVCGRGDRGGTAVVTEDEFVRFYCSRCGRVLCRAHPAQAQTAVVNHAYWRLADGSIPEVADVVKFWCECGHVFTGLPNRLRFIDAMDGVKVHL